ncbi:MFS transporter [Streptomyces sulfonofaciens]|uniref:MFS transporter n=1 Tax=Streptomyces sulfonofaciens TaxID=68272 RepID=A0A919GAQ1_9ACTN|nr:MFS transporter [Streptomyces sulfonofaciens]GHH81050.1 MFS transporter [Streptomyces sulfonofaciens]
MTLTLSCTAYFLVLFDASVMTVALPSIQADLGFAPVDLQWVVNAYALAFAGLLLLGGRLADLYGHRRVFVGGLVLFTAASLVGGLAVSPVMLIAARAGQGLGAAVLTPLALTMLTTTFPEGPRRTRALAIWTPVSLVGAAAGNALGGVLTEYLTWRSALLINVPIGCAAILCATRVVFRGAPRRRVRLDLPGAVLATTALTLLTLGTAQAHTHAWSDPATALPLVGGIAALAAFAVVEARFAPAPLIPPHLLRLPGIGWGNLAILLSAAGMAPMWYCLTLTMQDVLHYSASRTGVGFLPHTLVMLLVGFRLTPRLMRYVQPRTLIAAGALMEVAGFWWQGGITSDSDYATGILGPAVLISFGAGLASTPLTTTVTAGVQPGDAGAASGLMNTTRQFGSAFGLAMVLTLSTTNTPAAPTAVAAGYGNAFHVMAVIVLALAALAPLLPSVRTPRTPPSTADRPEGASGRPPEAPGGPARGWRGRGERQRGLG